MAVAVIGIAVAVLTVLDAGVILNPPTFAIVSTAVSCAKVAVTVPLTVRDAVVFAEVAFTTVAPPLTVHFTK